VVETGLYLAEMCDTDTSHSRTLRGTNGAFHINLVASSKVLTRRDRPEWGPVSVVAR